jgi:hypothetical protein
MLQFSEQSPHFRKLRALAFAPATASLPAQRGQTTCTVRGGGIGPLGAQLLARMASLCGAKYPV